MNRVFIAFGSNMGNSSEIIEEALDKLDHPEARICIQKRSGIYRTKPYGYLAQPDFLNGAILAETELTCHQVLMRLQAIETELGRIRTIHWGPRTIDLDILFYNNEIINEPFLQVPHPDLQNRDFVLRPLCDLEEDYMHPVLQKTVGELLKQLLE